MASDKTPPKITGQVSLKYDSGSRKFYASANVKDDISGVDIARVYLSSPSKKYSSTIYLSYNLNTGLWDGWSSELNKYTETQFVPIKCIN